jgi:DNA polymerase-3 subunit delta
MIIKDYQLDKIFSLKEHFQAILIYGPNEGLVREKIKIIISKFENKEIISINGRDMDSDPFLLDQSLNTYSMFESNKVVLVENIKDKHLKDLDNIDYEKITNTILIVKESNLLKSSKLRKFFDSHKYFFSLACYEDDLKLMIKIIDSFARQNSIIFKRDVKEYLSQTLSVDRMISVQELEKIKLYYYNTNKDPELNEIKALLNDASSNTLQKINESVMNGKISKSSKIINKLIAEGTSPVSILRGLMNYINRIKAANIEIRKGKDFDDAVKILKPPLFWKDKDSFRTHCKYWPLFKLEKAINNLVEAEISCKADSKLSDLICERIVIQISKEGQLLIKN